MSMRIKFNVKNAILGCHNISDILAARDARILTGFSRSAVPRLLPLCRSDCTLYKHVTVKRNTFNDVEALVPEKLENLTSKWMPFDKPQTSKLFNEVLTGSICTPACGLPWETAYSFYYDKKSPQCPPSAPTARTDCPKTPVPPCPPPKLIPSCPKSSSCYPCKQPKKSDPCAKTTQCTLKTILVNNYRFYSASPCQPKAPRKKKVAAGPCSPKQAQYKVSPKCRPRPPKASRSKICKPKFGGSAPKKSPCKAKSKPKPASNPVCPPKKSSGGGSDKINKGPVCK